MRNSVRRFDRGGLASPTRLANGWLRVDGYIARSGLLEYRRADGTMQVEYRPNEEAFREDVLQSFDAVPLTDNHPAGGFLDATNTKAHQVGTVQRPTQDGNKVKASILVTDASVIQSMEAGKTELSCGYLCDLDETPGEFEGKRYDAIQRNVRGNHVALVSAGRAGPEVRVRMDNADAEVIHSRKAMHKIRIDEIEFEASEELAKAYAEALVKHTDALAALSAKVDASASEIKQLNEALAAAPAQVKAQMQARMELESSARKAMGEEAKFDGLDDVSVKRAVVEKVLDIKTDGKVDAYVDACFDLALTRASQVSAIAQARESTSPIHTDSLALSPVESAKAKFLAASRNAHIINKG